MSTPEPSAAARKAAEALFRKADQRCDHWVVHYDRRPCNSCWLDSIALALDAFAAQARAEERREIDRLRVLLADALCDCGPSGAPDPTAHDEACCQYVAAIRARGKDSSAP